MFIYNKVPFTVSIRSFCMILIHSIQAFIEEFFWNCKAKHLSRFLNYEPTDRLPYLFPERHENYAIRHLHSLTFCSDLRLFPSISPYLPALVLLKASILIAASILDILWS
jgi:hypothetical protein